MKVILVAIGKTEEPYLKEGIAIFEKRLARYVSFEKKEIPAVKGNLNPEEHKRREAELILNHPEVVSSDFFIVLDERGTQYSSEEFAVFLQKQFNKGLKKIVFAVGGPYGFSKKIYERANAKISLSSQTFSHQMIRLFFVEQLYRAMTILRGEKYHH